MCDSGTVGVVVFEVVQLMRERLSGMHVVEAVKPQCRLKRGRL